MSGDVDGSEAEPQAEADADAADDTEAEADADAEDDADAETDAGTEDDDAAEDTAEAVAAGETETALDADANSVPTAEGTTGSVASDVGSESGKRRGSQPSLSEVVGAVLLATIPVVLLALPIAGVLSVTGTIPGPLSTAPAAVVIAAVVALGGSFGSGPALVRRSLGKLPAADPIEPVEDRITERATAGGLEPPEIEFVDVDAATIAVVDGLSERTLIVPTRIQELDDDTQAAVIDHALARLETANATLVTALLAPALLVEAWTLLGLELARRREEPEEDDRLPQMLGAGDREEREVPWVVPAAGGVLLLIAVAPLWVVFAAGDRLLVGGGRTRADDVVAGDAEPGALADGLTFARDARGDRDWPPTLDRLSLLGMADPATQGVRGTSRIELRVRLARLRARENRTNPD